MPKAFGKRIQFDPEQVEKWLNANYPSKTVDLILTILENADEDFSQVQGNLEEQLSKRGAESISEDEQRFTSTSTTSGTEISAELTEPRSFEDDEPVLDN